MSDKWFYQVSKEELGPVPTAEIHQLVEYGTLGPRDQVRKDGTRRWIIIAAFQDQVGPPEEVKPSLEEFADLSEISFGTSEVDSHAAKTVTPPVPAPPEQTQTEVQCFCESMGQVLGPMSIHELIRLADAGTLGETDKVRFGEHGDWVVPMDIPELAAAIFSADFGTNEDSVDVDDQPPVEIATVEGQDTGDVQSNSVVETTEDADASPNKTAKKPQSAKAKAAAAKRKASRRKKKKESEKDALLEEIFNEVFTSDGRVKSDAQRGIAPRATDAAPTTAASGGLESLRATMPAEPSSSGMVPNQSPGPSPMSPAPRSLQAANMQAAIASASSRSTSRSAGSRFSMPEPKTLGIVGGVLAVLLIIGGWSTGMIGGGGASKPYLIEFAREYRSISATLTGPKWADFTQRARPKVEKIVEDLKALGAKTDKDKRMLEAGVIFLKLISFKVEDAKLRKDAYIQFLRQYPHK